MHDRKTKRLSAVMRWLAPHVGCAEHAVRRCSVALWYAFAGHMLHVRAARPLSFDISCPSPHVGCAVHAVRRCSVALWNVFAG